jgi:dopamine receptor D1
MNFSIKDFCQNSNETGLDYLRICYPYFAFQSILLTILEIGLGVSTIIFNMIVFKMISNKKDKKVVFDQILISHAIVDGVVGGIDLPFYHIYTILGKWPFGETFCIIWNSFDSSLNTITILHMLYMSWVRVMSIIQPKTYLQNKIIKHPFIVSLLCWLTGFLIWIPVNTCYITSNYPDGQCYILYKPVYIQFIITFLTWFLPLIIIVCMLLYLMRALKIKNSKKKIILKSNVSNAVTGFTNITKIATQSVKNNKSNTKKKQLIAETKLSIILIVYLVQWVPSCLIWMIDSLCNCVPIGISKITYWLTFTVALTDSILLLALNTNFRKGNK